MTVAQPRTTAAAPALLLAGFALAVALRVALGGPAVATSAPAGLVFAATLALLGAAARPASSARPRVLLAGLGAGALLCLPVLLRGAPGATGSAGFLHWAVVVGVVATAEELFLRGVLYEAVAERVGVGAAVVCAAVAFALLHVPLYGWHVLPLDLVVGLVLGELRHQTGSWVAPAVAHVGADWAGWFLL